MKKTTLLAPVFASLMPAVASAALSFSATSSVYDMTAFQTIPSGNVVSQITPSDGSDRPGILGTFAFGVDIPVNELSFLMWNYNDNLEVTLTLYDLGTSAVGSTLPAVPGTMLATDTFAIPAGTKASFGNAQPSTMTWALGSVVNLQAANTYAVAVTVADGVNSPVNWRYGPATEEGFVSSNLANPWELLTTLSGDDSSVFAIGATPIPEPSSIVAFLAGLISIALVLRRTHRQ